MDRSPGLGSSSSALFEFRLFDTLRLPASEADDKSSFFGVTALLRLISVLDDWEVPFRSEKFGLLVGWTKNFIGWDKINVLKSLDARQKPLSPPKKLRNFRKINYLECVACMQTMAANKRMKMYLLKNYSTNSSMHTHFHRHRGHLALQIQRNCINIAICSFKWK